MYPGVTLPSATGIAGRVYTIKVVLCFYPLTVGTYSSQTIDRNSSVTLTDLEWVTVVSDGSDWWIIGRNP